MSYYADLHIHSRYSRATSKTCDLFHLSHWARKKGLAVLGTGDFTHPGWMAELREQLIAAEPGLYRLRPEMERQIEEGLPSACAGPTRFLLSVEISTIYKKGDKTRKVHHVVYAPDLDAAERVTTALGLVGNLKSDGRPILGLDSRDLLEIVLEADERAYLVPAHIWTPWFSALGSKSGFDSIAECYGDLADHIFAVETGLSSDPEMNWRVSSLDGYRLVSNSDAHSPPVLGREANLFDGEMDYFAIRRALETGEGYVGTVEFYPEEGKYHLDGHRKCDVRLTPEETRAVGGRCPVCGKPVTVGVMHRVEELADRAADAPPPDTAGEVQSLVPLPEIIGEIEGVGPKSKRVARIYEHLVREVGPELFLLTAAPLEDIRRASSPVLEEAIARLRRRDVIREAGYDGEYGVIRLFDERELRRERRGGLLFELPEPAPAPAPRTPPAEGDATAATGEQPPPGLPVDADLPLLTFAAVVAAPESRPECLLDALDADQRAAAEVLDGPVMIVAGPGSGKTRTLTHRIAHLVAIGEVSPDHCLAITFTRRAARELRERLRVLLPEGGEDVSVHTFHGLAFELLREYAEAAGLPTDFRVAEDEERVALLQAVAGIPARRAPARLTALSRAKRTGEADGELAALRKTYDDTLADRGWLDFDDLVQRSAALLEGDEEIRQAVRARYRHVSVDEYQDVDTQQVRLLAALVPPDGDVCVIGDPDQAIYGFRGAEVALFHRFVEERPGAQVFRLTRNYRSGRSIVEGAGQVLTGGDGVERALEVMLDGPGAARLPAARPEHIEIHEAPTDRAEAEFVVKTIEGLIGGHSFFSVDSGRAAGGRAAEGSDPDLSFADIAVLVRTAAQTEPLEEALGRSGMPFQVPADDGEDWDPRADRISVMTLHAAKGLEFPVVFIVGCEDGLLPLRFGPDDGIDEAEERRLFFVGMTRAERRLWLCHARKRMWRGRVRERFPSPFLRAIEERLLRRHDVELPGRRRDHGQMALF